MEEIWRSVPGYEGKYMVSNLGRLYSCSREYRTGQHSARIEMQGRIMIQKKKGNGYFSICLRGDNGPKDYYVHRLVALVFVPNPHNFMVVNHKDNNPQNNCADNLEWCTHQYNTVYNDAHLIGARKRRKPIVQKTPDGEIVREWDSVKDAAISFCRKSAEKNINNALKNPKRATAYNYVWEYV